MESNNKGLPDDWEGELEKEEVKEGKRKEQSKMRAKVKEQDRDNIRDQKLERELKEGTAKKNKDGSYSKIDEEEEEEPQPKPRKQSKRKEPSTLKNYGLPSWLGRGGGMPPAMRTGSGKLPPVYSRGGGAMQPAFRTGPGKLPPAYSMGGQPPAWLFGGILDAPAPSKGKKKSQKSQGTGLPPWFRY